ncbi:Transposase, partial [Cordylochernes scorpioides]
MNGPIEATQMRVDERFVISRKENKFYGRRQESSGVAFMEADVLNYEFTKNLADDLKWRAVGRMEAGQSHVEVAKWLNVNKSVVSKIWKQFIETGTIKRKEGSGRKIKTATSEDRYLVVTAKRHREMTAIQLSNELSSATGTRISRQTVYRRLHEGALYARRSMVCIPLISAHRRARLNRCLEHHPWTHDQWANVLFSDESSFSLNTDSRRVFIWRDPGTRYHPSNIREIDSFRGGSLLVWAGISSSRRTPLHIFSGDTLTAQSSTPISIVSMPRQKIRAHYEHMSEFETGRAIGLKEAGWSNRLIARHLCRSDAAIRRCWQKWVNNGRMQRQDGSGRPRATTEREDRMAVAAPETVLLWIVFNLAELFRDQQ